MKTICFLAAAALAVTSATAPITPVLADPAAAPGQNGSDAELLAFCESIITSGDYSDALTFGRCMSFNDTSIQGLATQTCMAFRGEGLLQDYGFATFEDCVTTLQQLY